MAAEPTSSMACDPVGHIARSPEIMSNRPRIAGTRIRVMDVVAWHVYHKMPVDEILENFPQLTAGDVHAALAYYHDNREEIEESFAEAERRAEQFARDHPDKVFIVPDE
jgi:uncharacterized protein (DUF433 family)